MRFCTRMPLIMHIYVSGNVGLGGLLPTEFSNCPLLMTLHLADTNVGGAVPAGMGKLPLLRDVNASNSQLTGELPACGVLSGRASDRGADFEGTNVKGSAGGSEQGAVDGKSVAIGVASSVGVAALIAAVVMHRRKKDLRTSRHTELEGGDKVNGL